MQKEHLRKLRNFAGVAAALGLAAGSIGCGRGNQEEGPPQVLLPPNQVFGNISITELEENGVSVPVFYRDNGQLIMDRWLVQKPEWLTHETKIDNPICFSWPVYGPISRYFGEPTGGFSFHEGIDIDEYFNYGDPVVAAADGVSEGVVWDDIGLGHHIVIKHGDGWSTVYGHMADLLVGPAETVVAGQVIGTVGSTGYSSGPHLHFETRFQGIPVDPLKFLPSGDPLKCEFEK